MSLFLIENNCLRADFKIKREMFDPSFMRGICLSPTSLRVFGLSDDTGYFNPRFPTSIVFIYID